MMHLELTAQNQEALSHLCSVQYETPAENWRLGLYMRRIAGYPFR